MNTKLNQFCSYFEVVSMGYFALIFAACSVDVVFHVEETGFDLR